MQWWQICHYFFLRASYILDKLRWKWTGRRAVEFNIENERSTVRRSGCRWNLKFGYFTLSFGRLRQRILLKCVLHVQHDYCPHLTNQIIVFWRCLCRCCRPCLSSLMARKEEGKRSYQAKSYLNQTIIIIMLMSLPTSLESPQISQENQQHFLGFNFSSIIFSLIEKLHNVLLFKNLLFFWGCSFWFYRKSLKRERKHCKNFSTKVKSFLS